MDVSRMGGDSCQNVHFFFGGGVFKQGYQIWRACFFFFKLEGELYGRGAEKEYLIFGRRDFFALALSLGLLGTRLYYSFAYRHTDWRLLLPALCVLIGEAALLEKIVLSLSRSIELSIQCLMAVKRDDVTQKVLEYIAVLLKAVDYLKSSTGEGSSRQLGHGGHLSSAMASSLTTALSGPSTSSLASGSGVSEEMNYLFRWNRNQLFWNISGVVRHGRVYTEP